MTTAASITVRVPLKIWRRPVRKTVVTPMADGTAPAIATRCDPALAKALARAFRYQRMLDEGRYAAISEMAEGVKLERGYLGSLLRLTLSAPDIVEAILDGRQPDDLTIAVLDGTVSCNWDDQLAAFGRSRPEAPQTQRTGNFETRLTRSGVFED